MRRACLLGIMAMALPVWADVVQLVPPGQTSVTLQPGSTRALVREARPLLLPAGRSSVSFSWTKANVDANSVALALDKGTVGEAIRPPGQDRTLVWQVDNPAAGAVNATVSYFLDGAKWQPSYVLTLDLAQGTASLDGNLSLTNETGAALERVCLQVGAAATMWADQPAQAATTSAPLAPLTVEVGETVNLTFLSLKDLPAPLSYVYQADRYGGNIEQILRLGLDRTRITAATLPDGPMVIQRAGDPQVAVFKTQLDLQPDKDFEVDMGPEPDIVVERKLLASRRGNFDFDRFGRVAGSDTTEEFLLAVRNHLDRAVTLEVVETVLNTWDLKGPEPVKRDTSWVRFDVPVAATAASELRFSFVKHAGTRAKK